MPNITIDNLTYTMPSGWGGITLKEAADAYPVLMRLPDKIKKIYGLMFVKDGKKEVEKIEITETEMQSAVLIYSELISLFGAVPKEVIEKTRHEDITDVYNRFLLPFCVGLLVYPYNHEPSDIKSFTLEGIEYFLPSIEKDINGDYRPLANESTEVFSEAADLQLASEKTKKGNLHYMSNIISILCRPDGEKYDEKTSLARTKSFEKLDMATVWDVFFCFQMSLNISENISLMFSGARVPGAAMFPNMDGLLPS